MHSSVSVESVEYNSRGTYMWCPNNDLKLLQDSEIPTKTSKTEPVIFVVNLLKYIFIVALLP